ncbi:hypothetical protein BS78_K196300 [Paspalum vaginatum]|uniref:Ergosterol biosynthetic protein 28 n=1 Tax=Paspalum vaginatum TaxID=158149 RepID=A0A9W8CGD3_9POAL|nr:hypothetical protein BS78_K196300 [Paspalum vaginatum]KAJ1257171.1 hypothetical protein BS78_K196300 [Paspalum vaginatum]
MACVWSWKKHSGVPALGWWLIAVGIFRSAFTWSCFFGSASLCSATFSRASSVSDVHGRTVGVWTLLSCTLCFLCAFNLHSKPLYVATFLSFVYGIAYLAVECLIYHTILFPSSVPFIFFAGTSIVWMLLQWNAHGGHAPPRPCGGTKQP